MCDSQISLDEQTVVHNVVNEDSKDSSVTQTEKHLDATMEDISNEPEEESSGNTTEHSLKRNEQKSSATALGRSSTGKVTEPICIQSNMLSCDSANQLVEYLWPLDGGEYYLLQEQVCAFLNITSFKRKYPDIKRKKLESEEILYLQQYHNINDAQMQLGLTALRSSDVCEMMIEEFPEKFKLFSAVMQEREKERMKSQYAAYAKSNANVEKTLLPSMRKKLIKQAASYNASLNKYRREEFSVYYDAHTNVLQRPAHSVRKLDPRYTKPSLYPCALIPGQFQEYCKRYTKQELMYLPVKTALYGPPQPSVEKCIISSCSESESEPEEEEKVMVAQADGSFTELMTLDKFTAEEKDAEKVLLDAETEEASKTPVCGICSKDETCNKEGHPENMIKCTQCDNHGHPSCLEMNNELLEVMKTYDWQCMECKNCTICSQPTREDLMMFCDRCDRGYHSYCVSLRNIPTGVWACSRCVHEDPKFKKRKTKELKLLMIAQGITNDTPVKRGRQPKSKSKAKLVAEEKKLSVEKLKKAEKDDKTAAKDVKTPGKDVKAESKNKNEQVAQVQSKSVNGKGRRKRKLSLS